MNSRDVITLNKVIGVDLPIGVKYQGSLFCPVVVLNRILPDLIQEPAQLVSQRLRTFDTGKNQSAPKRNRDVMQRPILKRQ